MNFELLSEEKIYNLDMDGKRMIIHFFKNTSPKCPKHFWLCVGAEVEPKGPVLDFHKYYTTSPIQRDYPDVYAEILKIEEELNKGEK